MIVYVILFVIFAVIGCAGRAWWNIHNGHDWTGR